MCNIGEILEELIDDYNSFLSYSSPDLKKKILNNMKTNIDLAERGVRRWIIEMEKD